jgi:hypothetical protein
MDVRGPVIVGVDHGTQAAKAKDRRHGGMMHKPKRLGNYFKPPRTDSVMEFH